MSNIDLNKYKDFVKAVTSDESNYTSTMTENLVKLERENKNIKMALLMTGAIGISAEGGEFAEIVKKVVFQGKPMNDETVFHCKRELGDIMWYWINACRALGLDPNDVIAENVKKLEARYPGGSFDAFYSENRKDGDL
jgi:NTP pyrophosphatase (non-canonical NTP hydrolase)|tara:strand:- start:5486 stop:5899 length:414 start_codon:yes stop_codon:yes gene_type:complete